MIDSELSRLLREDGFLPVRILIGQDFSPALPELKLLLGGEILEARVIPVERFLSEDAIPVNQLSSAVYVKPTDAFRREDPSYCDPNRTLGVHYRTQGDQVGVQLNCIL